MTLVPVYKKCPKCKKKYSWNPDVGHMWCPTCGPASLPGAGDIPRGEKVGDKIEIIDIFRKKK